MPFKKGNVNNVQHLFVVQVKLHYLIPRGILTISHDDYYIYNIQYMKSSIVIVLYSSFGLF